MVDLIEFFSTGRYESNATGPVEVELILGGDYFDFLNVPYQGEFEDAVDEAISVYKVEAIIKGHPKVMAALKTFASLPGKRITYLIGNHDQDLFFEAVRNRIIREWDPKGECPSEKVRIIYQTDRIIFEEEGLEIHHGNQFETANELDFSEPFFKTRGGHEFLKIPWGNIFVLKIINRLKWEREYIDKVRPVKVYVLFGLLVDPLFTLKFCFLSVFYFFKTKISGVYSQKRYQFQDWVNYFRQETTYFLDLEAQAREVLDQSPKIRTVIMGHTHRPMDKIYPDGKQYINTGTWTKMIQLDFRGLGQSYMRTFAFIKIRNGKARCELRQWVGESGPHKMFTG
jgi:UDP-2,3-diacylglucosamine pyrophosphatase LpxH